MASGKARAIGESEGFVKLIVGEPHGEILGAHIIGPEATEMIAELGLAITLEATWEEIEATIHAHPTLSEGVQRSRGSRRGTRDPHLERFKPKCGRFARAWFTDPSHDQRTGCAGADSMSIHAGTA